MSNFKYFDQQRQAISDRISKYQEHAIQEDRITHELTDMYRIEFPYLDKEDISISIKEEVLKIGYNAPEGISFTPGNKVQYALYNISIKGSLDAFNNIMEQHSTAGGLSYGGGYLIYKHYSYNKAINNAQVQAEIKQAAKFHIDKVDSTLQDFKGEAEMFNDKLPAYIEALVKQKLATINKRQSDEEALNPFT